MFWARSWSPDGRYIFLDVVPPNRSFLAMNIQVLPLAGNRKLLSPFDDNFRHLTPMISPDSKWLAYVSDESGHEEIYVQPFPGPGPRTRLTSGGGIMPRWRGDGRELFFINGDNR